MDKNNYPEAYLEHFLAMYKGDLSKNETVKHFKLAVSMEGTKYLEGVLNDFITMENHGDHEYFIEYSKELGQTTIDKVAMNTIYIELKKYLEESEKPLKSIAERCFENIWFLPEESTWENFDLLAMKDRGILTISDQGLYFNGNRTALKIDKISHLEFGKQGRDFINNWVKLTYINDDNETKTVYFADGRIAGWSGIFGGTKRLFNSIKKTVTMLES